MKYNNYKEARKANGGPDGIMYAVDWDNGMASVYGWGEDMPSGRQPASLAEIVFQREIAEARTCPHCGAGVRYLRRHDGVKTTRIEGFECECWRDGEASSIGEAFLNARPTGV